MPIPLPKLATITTTKTTTTTKVTTAITTTTTTITSTTWVTKIDRILNKPIISTRKRKTDFIDNLMVPYACQNEKNMADCFVDTLRRSRS